MNTEKKLTRNLTPFDVWSIAFGCVIGFGAFVMPGTVFLKRAGTLGTLIAIELGALIMLIISYSYSYMIQRFPVAGGEFIYAEKSFGKKHGFVCAWFLGLSYLCLVPVNANAIAVLFRVLFKGAFQFKFLYSIAGDNIFLGEIMLALAAIIIFAVMSILTIKITGTIQKILVLLLLSGVIILIFAAIFSPSTNSANLQPLFYPVQDVKGNKAAAVFFRVISVSSVAPWAFVGFDTIPQLSEEAKFNMDKVKVLMDTCILCGCFVYIALTLFAASYLPDTYGNWAEYIDELPNIHGIASVPILFAAYKIMGTSGLFVAGVAALCAMLTGIIGFYVATSRLLYSMSRDKMLHEWFGRLNIYNAPMNAVLFCMFISVIVAFLGRNSLGWAVDMSSIGGTISFGYTSLATMKYARQERKKDMIIFAAIGFIFSVLFAVVLLVPLSVIPEASLSFQSYICLILWILLGILFYRKI
ncbi:MAG: APC family permease [Synergistaceae bacterium]|nr:APC family permease [Synergistaceae bacterium]